MRQSVSDALRRADCSLAGALFLSLSTVAAVAAYNPALPVNAVLRPKVLDSIQEDVQQFVALDVPAPDVLPVPRPSPLISRLRVNVALEDFASEATCLAEAMYYEARGEGLAGEKAIAEVVVRRTHRAGYPRSICGVVHQGQGVACQFSFVCDGTLQRPKTPHDWSRAVRLATRILTGALPLTDITNGAIAFHAVQVQPDWPGLVQTVRIGNHIFYRRPGRSRRI